MNIEPDQSKPLPERTECPEGNLAAAQDRIRQLEDELCEAEQELKAANEIIEELDWKIEELKIQLDGADMMLEDAAEARRKLERRLAEAEQAQATGTPICSLDELDACQITDAVQKGRIPAPPLPPVENGHRGYPPGYKPNPVVEAMIAQFKAREKK